MFQGRPAMCAATMPYWIKIVVPPDHDRCTGRSVATLPLAQNQSPDGRPWFHQDRAWLLNVSAERDRLLLGNT